MTTVVLICAVFASLAGGVLLAHTVCIGMFQMFRIHSLQVAQQRAENHAAQAVDTASLLTN